MHCVELGGVLEQLCIELAHAARPGAAEVELAGVGLHMRNEFLERLRRHGRVDHQHVGRARQLRDGCEVLDRVVAHVGLGERVGQVRALRGHHQRVAIGLGTRHLGAGDGAARTGPVVHHHRSAQRLGQRLGIEPSDQIDRAARGERHHQRDRPRRKRLCAGSEGQRSSNARAQKRAAAQGEDRGGGVHGLPVVSGKFADIFAVLFNFCNNICKMDGTPDLRTIPWP